MARNTRRNSRGGKRSVARSCVICGCHGVKLDKAGRCEDTEACQRRQPRLPGA